MSIDFRINSGQNIGAQSKVGLQRTVSRKRSYNFASDDRIEALKKYRMKKCTENKMNWGVRAYNEWRENRLVNFQYNYSIYNANLQDLENLKKDDFEHAMYRFIPEVTKQKGDGPYPGKTLYQLVVDIQKYLNFNKIMWKLVDLKGTEFEDLTNVLDNVMKEQTEMGVGTVKKQANLISYKYEEELWDKHILGEDSPIKLRNTVLFLIGINVALCGVEEHNLLRSDMPDRESQLSFQRDSRGIRCLVYTEDTCTKSNSGGLAHMRNDRKIVWVYPSDNVERCPVRLVDKYISLCPPYFKKPNFYLQAKQKINPAQWYSEQVVGSNSLGRVVKQLLLDAKIDGYFTNHSLRRTALTRLFQAGIKRKLVKEVTGHRSDVIDCYQITSEAQRQTLSEIIASKPVPKSVSASVGKCPETSIKESDQLADNSECDNVKVMKVCNCSNGLSGDTIAKLVDGVLGKISGDQKAVIKFQIEISKE